MINLRAINQNQFDLAKRWWGFSVGLKVLFFVIGSVFVFVAQVSPYVPHLLVAIAMISELAQWRSDAIKRRSEALLRKLDLCKSFDQDVSKMDKRDIIAYVPKKLRHEFRDGNILDSYFASNNPPGAQRAIENLLESAWYTRKQCGIMVVVSLCIILFVFTTSIMALLVTSGEVENLEVRENISRIVVSWLLLVFSLGLVKNTWAYYVMYRQCLTTESTAKHLLSGKVEETDALKQWYEYQLTRCSAPLIPALLWRVCKASLDDAWQSAMVESTSR